MTAGVCDSWSHLISSQEAARDKSGPPLPVLIQSGIPFLGMAMLINGGLGAELSQASLETCSQKCPGIFLLGDSKFCQVDKIGHLTILLLQS